MIEDQELNKIIDGSSGNVEWGVRQVNIRINLDGYMWFLDYPLEKFQWLENERQSVVFPHCPVSLCVNPSDPTCLESKPGREHQ